MATKIVTKNSSTASAVPTASDLVQGELAVNVADKRLFTEDSGGSIVELGTNPSTLTVTGEITANGGIALGDNDKATFGAGDDLQIYHTGSYSAITDVGTGAFYIGGADFVDIGNSTLSETSARFHVNDRVDLYHNNAVKLATTATGIDVTGTATMDGLVTQATANSYTAGAAQIKSLAGDISYITNVGGAFLISNSSTTDQFTLSSAGNVGIGTSSPSRALDLRPNATDDWQFRLGSNANALDTYDIGRDVGDGLLYFKGNQTGYTGYVFDSVDGERMRIDSSGNVAIGQQSTTGGSVKLDLHNSGSSVGTQIAFYNDHNTGGHFIGQAGNTTGNIIYYNVANTNQEFYNNNSLKMTLDASGNLLVGKTGINIGLTGQELRADGSSYFTASSDTALGLNRLSTDGKVLEIRKDNTVVGSIGTVGSNIVIGTGTVGLRFYDGGNAVIPHTAAGGSSNGLVDLGQGGFNQFKDLYLSGGVYLGGTGAANKLDDYEEGTWTGTLTGSTTAPSTAITATGTYTKIGRSVTAVISFSNKDSTGVSGNIIITGLPFTASAGGVGAGWHSRSNTGTGTTNGVMSYIGSNNDLLLVQGLGSSIAWVSAGTGTYAGYSITYEV